MIIPYRVKNPPKRFPMVTVTIIALNVLVYMLTSDHLQCVRREFVDEYALRWGVTPFKTLFTSMFLHADLFHLFGNILFLWVFGPAVEDRVGAPLFVGLYFLAGVAGHGAHGVLGAAGAFGLSVPMMGASGCIMGVLGAYWYLYSWSPVCLFYWIFISVGTFEVAAMWVIGAYIVMDLLNGVLARSYGVVGGVANFAHVGGAVAGATLVWALKFKRDTSEVSQAKAVQSEVKSPELLSYDELEKLIAASPEDTELLILYTQRAYRGGDADRLCFALSRDVRTVVISCPQDVSGYLVHLNGPTDLLAPADLLYLGKSCEAHRRPEWALHIYALIDEKHPNLPEAEIALYRTAAVLWHGKRDGVAACMKLRELLARFPMGPLVFEAENLLRAIEDSPAEAA